MIKTILVVDEDHGFRAHMKDVLGSAGYAVLGARDGVQAMQLVGQMQEALDAVVIDLSLPGLSGREMAGQICRRAPNVKLVATSAWFKNASTDAAKAYGAHAAISKTAGSDEWLRTVGSLLSDWTSPG
jgi:DNA-binding NarL/FixJ family response regulator